MNKLLWACAIFGVSVTLASAFGQHLHRFWLTGQFLPTQIIEKLDTPVKITGWTTDALLAEDSRSIRLPGVTRLLESSAALREAIQNGVEIAKDGRVYGLVRIHHWCGNDPVETHLARVDIASMLQFLDEGKHETISAARPPVYYGHFTKWGWKVNDYDRYQIWLEVDTNIQKEQTKP